MNKKEMNRAFERRNQSENIRNGNFFENTWDATTLKQNEKRGEENLFRNKEIK